MNEVKPMYKMKIFQTVSPKINTYNAKFSTAKDASTVGGGTAAVVAKKLNTRDQFLLDLSKEESMIDDVLKKTAGESMKQSSSI